MKHLYLYGASDDLGEIDWAYDAYAQSGGEETSSGKMLIRVEVPDIAGVPARYEVTALFTYDGDWGVALVGDVACGGAFPPGWIIKAIGGNMPTVDGITYDRFPGGGGKRRPNAGQFIHVQVPDDHILTFVEVTHGND